MLSRMNPVNPNKGTPIPLSIEEMTAPLSHMEGLLFTVFRFGFMDSGELAWTAKRSDGWEEVKMPLAARQGHVAAAAKRAGKELVEARDALREADQVFAAARIRIESIRVASDLIGLPVPE